MIKVGLKDYTAVVVELKAKVKQVKGSEYDDYFAKMCPNIK